MRVLVQQVLQVIARPGQAAYIHLQLRVDRLKLLVYGKNLFPGRGQLFIGTLQFFPDGLQILLRLLKLLRQRANTRVMSRREYGLGG